MPVVVIVVAEPHQLPEDIRLLEFRGPRFGLEGFVDMGDVLDGIHVRVQFVIETTFQSAALSAEFPRV